MAKRRIIITIDDNEITDTQALDYVQMVMYGGKVSKYQGTPQYCFVTTFKNGVKVYARDKKNINTDSFVVF